MTLTYELDLDILPRDLHTEILVRITVRLAVRVVTDRQISRESLAMRVVTDRQTHTHTDTQTMSKLFHPTRHRRGV